MTRWFPLTLACLFAVACSNSNSPADGGTTSSSTSAGSSTGANQGSTGSSSGASAGATTGGSTGAAASSGSAGNTGATTGAASTGGNGSTGGNSGGIGNVDGGLIGSLGMVTIGSTVDPINGDGNPYGLAIAPVTSGLMTAGDLVICNFNDAANVQGNGTTIEVIHPQPGSTPTQLVQDPNLKGCAALALDNTDSPWAAAYVSNLAPYYSSSGDLISTLSAGPWSGPWGEAYAPAFGSVPATFVTSNATNGSIVRVNAIGTVFTTIATGFSINVGAVPGNILGAAGLTYDAKKDILYIVDSNQTRVVAFAGYSTLPANGIVVNADGTFSGPSAASASVLFSGAPLNMPLSAAELFNGDLVVGNTGDNNLVEISASGHLVGLQNLDNGPIGALFGIAATGTSFADTAIYFNDDNTNSVNVLSAVGQIGSTFTEIGSTIDPTNGDENPYGLAIAPATSGAMTAGDLVICNFNDSANIQGNGTTIELLHPTPGATPTRLVQDPNLKGCAALALDDTDSPWAAAYVANLAPYYSSTGSLISTLSSETWAGPWGEAYAPAFGSAPATFVTSNANDGSIVRVNAIGTTFTKIASGFSLNAGAVPGNILGASGLTYDATNDNLFVVDSNLNRVVILRGYSTLPANGITVNADGSFSGPSSSSVLVLYSGLPLNAPLSAAELFNGNLIVGNTADNNLVEISPTGTVVGLQSLDQGPIGALFGIVATGSSAATTKIYFNDDNTNSVFLLTP